MLIQVLALSHLDYCNYICHQTSATSPQCCSPSGVQPCSSHSSSTFTILAPCSCSHPLQDSDGRLQHSEGHSSFLTPRHSQTGETLSLYGPCGCLPRLFCFSAPQWWNELPTEVKTACRITAHLPPQAESPLFQTTPQH